MYAIHEVCGADYADELNRLNAQFPDDFLPLKPKHLAKGFWWLVQLEHQIVGFAGMVPFDPFPRTGYFKRAAVLPAHRGNGLQERLMTVRLEKAKAATDWTHIVSECHFENIASANNFIRAGFLLCEAERPWEKETLFWTKDLTT
jgi:GNAT superfamily N-acetyltransferase